ncbi:hypothetical protein SAMN05216303_101839 [Rhodoferax sp. OV413]|uniref:hypothetical protein n=1 Tax=Rhodoferax sp. OV413 TaxID=1855285 RepID=UPI0008909BDB|nr:hypothetical protein [Rhodoferax sp. OV413]SDO21821.1 hypothetical protein SAMN05216303_101839 [Rhodoferax sp. OV413]
MDYANASAPTQNRPFPSLRQALLQAWRSATAWRRPAEPAPLGELGAHLLRDIDVPGRIPGKLREQVELARYDRRQQHDKY